MHLADDAEPLDDDAIALEHLARYVAVARDRGVAEIGFAEHVYRFREAAGWIDHELWAAPAAEIDRYVDAVRAAADAGLPVRLGLELDYVAGAEPRIAALAAPYPWDYLLGSVHWVPGGMVDYAAASIWDTVSVADVWERYVDAWTAAAASGLYDSMSHPDLAKVFGHRPDPKPYRLYDAMADAAAAGGVAVEVSTGGLRKAIGELYPDPELLSRFRARGVPVTLGADAHRPEDVGRAFDRAVAALAGAGYTTVTRFRARERSQVALDG
jgi:histidinol-phosphatase (PHP family)